MHGHSDHARRGHDKALATRETLAITAIRYGGGFVGQTQAIAYGPSLCLGDAQIVSFHEVSKSQPDSLRQSGA